MRLNPILLVTVLSAAAACSGSKKNSGSDTTSGGSSDAPTVTDFQAGGDAYLGYIKATWTQPEQGADELVLVFLEGSESVPNDCAKGIEHAVTPAPQPGDAVAFSLRVGNAGSNGHARLCRKQGDSATAISASKFVQAGADHRAFLTSELFNGDLAADYRGINKGQRFASGLTGADARCQALGADINPPSTKWKAVLSDAGENALDRLPLVGYFHNLAGERVTTNLFMTPEAFLKPMNGNEKGETMTNLTPWLATNTTGVNASIASCSNWSSADAGSQGGYGSMDGTQTEWGNVGAAPCNETRPLLCIEL